jgi:hypothetical protein
VRRVGVMAWVQANPSLSVGSWSGTPTSRTAWGPALRAVALLVLAATAAVVAGYGKGAHPSRTAAVSGRTKESVA